MRIYIASDHGGFEYKEALKGYLGELGYEVEDMGAYEKHEDDDYPDYVIPLAQRVISDGGDSVGIVLGRSGNGEAIAANKVLGVRAAVCTNVEMAVKAREHNDANVLSIGADYVSLELAREMVKAFLETQFSGEERHKRRLQKVALYESSRW